MRNSKTNTNFLAGALGGCLLIFIFIVIAFCALHLFDYKICIDKVCVNSANLNDSTQNICPDSCYAEYQTHKQILFDDLKKEKLILTPQEYTSNLANYYNSILLILSVMIAAFSVISFIYLRNQSKDIINEILESDNFQDKVEDKVKGKVEGTFREELATQTLTINTLVERISALEAQIEDMNIDSEQIVDL